MKCVTFFQTLRRVPMLRRAFLVALLFIHTLDSSVVSLSVSTWKRGRQSDGVMSTARPSHCIISKVPYPQKRVDTIMSSTDTTASYQDPSSSFSLNDSKQLEDSIGTTTTTRNTSLVVPSYRKLLVFVGTTVLIWLSEPLLSLVDTTVVGRSPTTSAYNNLLELAALGPATMLIDSGVYITYFLAIAATNVVAKSLAKRDYRALRQHSSHVLGVASVLGFLVTAVVFVFGKPLLTSWTAGAVSSPLLVQAAFSYAKIRSVVAPLVIMDLVAQSICLACLDTITPAVAVAVASLVNIVGDVLLVTKYGMGIQGAAIATAVASVSSSLVLLRQIKKKMNAWKEHEKQDLKLELRKELDSDVAKDDVVADDGIQTIAVELNRNTEEGEMVLNGSTSKDDISNSDDFVKEDNDGEVTEANASPNGVIEADRKLQIQDIPFVSLPDRTALLKLLRLAGPICFVIVGKVVCYSAMTLRATDFGVLRLASHNVMMRVFFFFTTFGDSISQAAQTFVPQVLYHTDGARHQKGSNKVDLKKLLLRLGVLSAFVGVIGSNLAGWILRSCGSSFTKDTAIIKLMGKYTRFFGLSLFIHPFIMLFEGALVATRDLTHLVGSYAITMCLLIAQLKFVCSDFSGVWRALFVFQLLRLVQFSTRFFSKVVRQKSSHPVNS